MATSPVNGPGDGVGENSLVRIGGTASTAKRRGPVRSKPGGISTGSDLPGDDIDPTTQPFGPVTGAYATSDGTTAAEIDSVAAGGPLGADDHVRASIRGAGGTDRLIEALKETLT